MGKKLARGILVVFIANVINLVFSLATNFLLPKYLSVDSYAQIKTFQLYVSYAGLLHFGFVDSVYLKYGGQELTRELDKSFYRNISTMRIFQLAVTVALLISGLIANEPVLMFFAVSILPINMSGYFKFLYQATGDFSLYGRIMNVTTISTFIVNMFLLFVIKTDMFRLYILGYVVIYFVVWAALEIGFRRKHRMEKGELFTFAELFQNIKDGIFLTIGNLASNFLTSMDRWFVKFLMTTLDFAQYSFAVSMEGFLNLAITPVTTTMYNYFCRETDEKKHRVVLEYIVLFATALPLAAFPAKFILEVFLQKYIDSSNVIFLLFAAQMFYIVIKSVFVNLYKVYRKQTRYFVKLVSVLAAGFVLNFVFFQIMGVKEAFAIGTLISAVFWFIITLFDFKYMQIPVRVYFFMAAQLAAFLFCGFFFNSIIGFALYAGFSVAFSLVFMRKPLFGIVAIGKKALAKKLGKNKAAA